MQRASPIEAGVSRPQFDAMLELLKPVTWFPPMWAFMCGAVSAGSSLIDNPLLIIAGICLTGPLVCGASQVVNDWFDRHVDAINEPNRPIPSGRVPGKTGLYFAIIWSAIALAWSLILGTWVFIATIGGLILAWAYSAPPVRLKGNGWWGNAAVGLSYEGLAWATGAAVMLGGQLPGYPVLLVAALYSIGAHGIMTLNDFKSVIGDRQMGVKSLPASLGIERAARLACVVMIIPQLAVIAALIYWQAHWQGVAITILVIGQLAAMFHMLKRPRELAPWYNGTGVSAYVTGMMISATALHGVAS